MTVRWHPVKLTLATVVAIGIFGAGIAFRGVAARQSADDFVSGPARWVPLMYEAASLRNGVAEYSYIVVRSANGSTRRERHDGRDIQILDVAGKKYFRLHQDHWTQHPMRPQPNGGLPYLRIPRHATAVVSPDDPRVSSIASIGIPVTFYEWTPQPGNVRIIVCPELNMLEVWSLRGEEAGMILERRVTNITLGERDMPLAPPDGAKVMVSPEPAGPGRVVQRPGR